MKKRKITCYCENEVEIEVPDTLDLAADPEKEQEILEGILNEEDAHIDGIEEIQDEIEQMGIQVFLSTQV